MPEFSPNDYGPAVAALFDGALPMPLDAGTPNLKARPRLAALSLEGLGRAAGKPIADANMANACLSGLWLRHNFLDESHALSQDIPTPTGSFWHAILHRREPDYGNARYWFRQTGGHPVHASLAAAAVQLGWPKQTRWDEFSFITVVQKALQTDAAASIESLTRLQQVEWELLFDYSWRKAFSA